MSVFTLLLLKMEYIKINKNNWEIAIRDIGLVASFLEGMSIEKDERNSFILEQNTHKLTNAIQWLNNWGDEEAKKEKLKDEVSKNKCNDLQK